MSGARIGARAIALAAVMCIVCLAAAPARAATWEEEFDYPDGSYGEPTWRADSVAWVVRDGRMTFEGGQKTFCDLQAAPRGRRVEVEASLSVGRRTGPGWAVAGVAVRRDPENYWHLALIESPDAEGRSRSVELVESHQGRWLANFQGATALPRTADEGGGFAWQYGRAYRLRLELGPDRITGTVRSPEGRVLRRIAFSFPEDAPAVRAGRPALEASLCAGGFDRVSAAVRETVSIPVESRPEPPPYEGPGCSEVSGEATGFFHLKRVNGTWWLIDPKGRGFYIVGTDHAKYTAHWCQELGYAPYHRNVEAKYGGEEAWAEATAERLHRLGFNALTAGHSESLRYRGLPHTGWLAVGRRFADISNIVPRTTWTGFPNVFSPRWPRHCDLVAREVCAPNRDDPWLIGYFLDNELEWHGERWNDEFGLFLATWKKPPEHSAKRAWLRMLRERFGTIEAFNRAWDTEFASFQALSESTDPRRPPGEEAKAAARAFVREVARRYFSEAVRAVRRYDPNHLVLGTRFAGWSPHVWDICGEHCDVVSFNNYPRIDVERGVPQNVVEKYRRIHRRAGAPLMVTEWSFPALDSGLPCEHGAGMRVATQTQKARCFRFLQHTHFSLPFMVGSDYFMYVDEPELGISDTFPEDSNYGLVDVNDELWPEPAAAAEELNPRVCRLHAEGEPRYVVPPAPAVGWKRQPPPASEGAEPPSRLRIGPLELRRTPEEAGWRMRYRGKRLGRFVPLLHQRGERDEWNRAESARLTAVREDESMTVVDATAERRHEGSGWQAGWRFWIPRRSGGWFGAQNLWVRNTGNRSWTLAGIFHYTIPAIGGDPAGDEEAPLNVPNFYLPLGGWQDAEAGVGQGVTALGAGLRITYWKDADGFHSDCRQGLDVRLEPGQTYSRPGPVALVFGYRPEGDGLLAAANRVHRGATALQP